MNKDKLIEEAEKMMFSESYHYAADGNVLEQADFKAVATAIVENTMKQDAWVSVEDRLPECLYTSSNLRKVFVLFEDGGVERAEYSESSRLFWDEWSDEFESVISWQYDNLPRPPKDTK